MGLKKGCFQNVELKSMKRQIWEQYTFEKKLTVIPVKLVEHSVGPLSPLLIDEAKTEPKEGKLVHHMVLQNV